MEEIVKYPQDFFGKNGIKKIHLLNDMKVNGDLSVGFHNPFNKEIFIEYQGDRETFSGMAFHHELFHYLDMRLLTLENEEYIKLRGLYEDVYFLCSENTLCNERQRESLSEDLADMASIMMNPNYATSMKTYFIEKGDERSNTMLDLKYSIMIKMVSLFSRNKMTDKYWIDLLNGEVTADYFNKNS